MADKPKSFSEYYAEAQKKVGTPAPKKARSAPSASPQISSFGSSGAKKNEAQTPLDFIVDMISRPLYGVTNALDKQLDQTKSTNEKFAKGDVGGALGEIGMGILKNGVVKTDFFDGVTSTDKAKKVLTSDLIEKSTDVVGEGYTPDGQRIDKDYVNEKDNVSPVAKGIAGFVGDVALDPLTYVPGAAFLSVGKKVAGLSKATLGVAKKASEGIKETLDTSAAARAADGAVDDVLGKAEGIKPADTSVPTGEHTGSALDDYTKQLNEMDDATFSQHLDTQMSTRANKIVGAATKTPKAQSIAKGLKEYASPREAKIGLSATKSPQAMKPLEFAPWVNDSVKAFKAESQPLTSYPKVSIGGVDTPLPVALSKAVQGDKVAIEDLKFWHENTYRSVFTKASKGGKLVNGLLKPINPVSKPAVDAAHLAQLEDDVADTADEVVRLSDPEELMAEFETRQFNDAAQGRPVDYTPDSILADAQDTAMQTAKAADDYRNTGTASVTLATGIQNMKMALQENRAAVENALTPALTQALEKFTSPETFDRTVRQLNEVLTMSLDLTTLTKLPTTMQKMLGELGVPVDVIPLGVRKWQAAAATTPPAKSIDELVSKGDVAARIAAGDSDPIIETATLGTAHAISHDILRQTAEYNFKSKTGALRTNELFGEGWGLNAREANNYFQSNIWAPMMKHVAIEADNLKRFGEPRMEFVKSRMMPAMRLAEAFYDQAGVPLTIGVGEGRVPIGRSEIIDILDSLDEQATKLYMWNGGTAVPHTNLLDAAHAAITTGRREAVEAALRQDTTRYLSAGGREVKFENRLVNPKGGERYRPPTGDELVNGLTELMMKAAPALQIKVAENVKALAARGVSETYEMTDANLRFLEETFSEGSIGDMLRALDGTNSRILKSAEEMGALKASTAKAKIMVNAFVPTGDKVMAKMGRRLEDHNAKAVGSVDAVQKAGNTIVQDAYDDVLNDGLKADLSGSTADFGKNIQRDINTGFVRKTRAIFDRGMNTGPLHEAMVRSENIFRDMVNANAKHLNRLSKLLASPNNETFRGVFNAVQRGVLPTDPKLAESADDVADIVDQMFGRVGETAFIDNRFFANNASIHHINSTMDYYKIGQLFDVEAAEAAAKLSGKSVMAEAAQQWRSWDVQDPAEFLNKMYTAMAKINADQTVVNQFQRMAKRLDGAVSKAPKKGFSRVEDSTGKSLFAKYLPEGMYYDDRILTQLHSVDNLMQERLDMGGDFGRFINDVYRPSLNMWKTGMTIVNPTHHFRNAVSDMTLTGLAEGFSSVKPSSFKKAMQVMQTRGQYTDFDAIAALNGINAVPSGAADIIKTRFGGVNADAVYSALATRGNLPRFHTLENLEDATDISTGALTKFQEKLGHTKPLEAAGTLTELRDHYARVQHFIVFVEKNAKSTKFKTQEALFDAASEQVRKWHPDGSDMTKVEQGFKLLVPFYSWQRKTIPLILESLLTQPARVMILPKAQFALATSMGIAPDSLEDPFPDDQMFPEYLTDQITGPAFEVNGKYYGINPGFAANDILNDYVGGDPLRAILGSTSPFIRAPFELATGAQVGTGGRINDTSDYLDSNIPLVGAASRITGTSVTGSLVSGLKGEGLDQQYQIQKGNKDPVGGPMMALTNWITGLGITPYSQQNQINQAEIEARDKLAEGKSF